MKAFERVTGIFTGAVAATALFAAPACSQDDAQARTTPVAMTTTAASAATIEFLDDADDAASEWVANHYDRVAVSIRLGGATTHAPEFIQSEIERVLAENRITNAVFFWERGLEDGATSVAIETKDMTFGPYGLTRELLVQHLPDAANQIRFNSRYAVASNTNALN